MNKKKVINSICNKFLGLITQLRLKNMFEFFDKTKKKDQILAKDMSLKNTNGLSKTGQNIHNIKLVHFFWVN